MSSFSRFMNKETRLCSIYLGLGINAIGTISIMPMATGACMLPFIDTGFNGRDLHHTATIMMAYPALYTGLLATIVWPTVFTTVVGVRLISFAVGLSEELSPKFSLTNKRALSLILKTNLIIGIIPIIAAPILCVCL